MIKTAFYLFIAIFLAMAFTGYLISSRPTPSLPAPINTPSTNKDKFEVAVNVIFRHEGRFSNNKYDRGGATMYGVSLRFLKAAGLDIDLDGDVDINDIRAIDKPHAKAIYKKYWWDKYQYNEIDSLTVSIKVFDLAINVGAKKAHKLTQIACNQLGYKLVIDGKLGVKSLSAINELSKSNEGKLVKAINAEAEKFYYQIVKDNPQFVVFLKGWLNRVNDPLP